MQTRYSEEHEVSKIVAAYVDNDAGEISPTQVEPHAKPSILETLRNRETPLLATPEAHGN